MHIYLALYIVGYIVAFILFKRYHKKKDHGYQNKHMVENFIVSGLSWLVVATFVLVYFLMRLVRVKWWNQPAKF